MSNIEFNMWISLNRIIHLNSLLCTALALDINFDDSSSIGTGLAAIADGLMHYYPGNLPGQTVGMFCNPYYWWEAGAAWGSLIDYWYYTGDETYNQDVKDSLLHQVSPTYDYMPENQTHSEGNDDQGFWGIAVMAAAEKGFPNTPSEPQWAELAKSVFSSMSSRWDTDNCGGGLRWQIYSWNNGYNYKNSVSNGCLFHLAARLARFTGESAYVEWADMVWNWMTDNQLIETSTDDWRVRDGASIESDCKTISPQRWTYNAGLFLSGSAFMYNHTGDSKWLDRANHLWEGSKVFFINDEIMYEGSCQISNRCNTDQRSFKGIFSRFLGLTAMLVPILKNDIMLHLQTTAPGILASCTGGSDNVTCGLDWSMSKWDGYFGLGEQISALEALQNRLVFTRPPPPTAVEIKQTMAGQDL